MKLTRLPAGRTCRALPAIVLLTLAAAGLTACHDGNDDASSTKASASTLHMVNNGGHRLAFHVTPGRSPAIVLDAGGGEDSSEWNDIVPKLHMATGSEIITYDRAGIGASDEVPGPWNVHNAVGDLEAGLKELGVTKDLILVSHSQAGEVAAYFVRARPQLVRGAVLVDASLPPFYTNEEIARVVAASKPQVDAAKQDMSSKANRQLVATAESYVPMHTAYHTVVWPDSVPATVIVSEKTPFDGSPQDAQRWRDAAASFAASGPDRTLVTAKGSSHEVPKDRPDLVLNEIEKIVAAHG